MRNFRKAGPSDAIREKRGNVTPFTGFLACIPP